MRVRHKLLILMFLLFMFSIFISIMVLASCTSDSDCDLGTYCDSGTGWCMDAVCPDNQCRGETSSTCCQDCGCGSFGDNYECINNQCVPSFSSDGVCEYGSGERIGDSGDDCDQDGDGFYDGCDGVGTSCSGVSGLQTQQIDICPDTETLPVSNLDGHYGCSCEQEEERSLCDGISYTCTDLDDECVLTNEISVGCTVRKDGTRSGT